MEGLDSMRAALSFSDFSFSYGQDSLAVPPVTWQVPAGSFMVLVGDTGCGKTTLLRNVKPQTAPVGIRKGDIALWGKSVFDDGGVLAPGAVGYVAQSPDNQLVCHTVWHEMAFGLENLGLDHQEMRRRVAEVCHFFGMGPWFNQQVDTLSGGQKQLLNLASVLVMQPELLLLDEPTAQLDPVAQRTFCHALFRLNKELGLTLVVATHTPQLFAPYATHAAVLDGQGVRPVPLDLVGEQVFDLSRANARRLPLPTQAPVALRAEDLRVSYGRGQEPVLQGVDLQIQQGTIHALVGGNGSGKTTLLKTLAGTLKPSRGKMWNGLRSKQAYLPQNPQALFVKDTVLEELMEWSAGDASYQGEVHRWLSRIGLSSHERQHPYDLSGGQKQLLGFTKLALVKPGLMLLDEPAKGLDASPKLLLAQLLQGLANDGVTVVLATHDLAFAACVAQRVSLLFDGQIACTQASADFFASSVFYRPQGDAFTKLYLQGEAAAALNGTTHE